MNGQSLKGGNALGMFLSLLTLASIQGMRIADDGRQRFVGLRIHRVYKVLGDWLIFMSWLGRDLGGWGRMEDRGKREEVSEEAMRNQMGGKEKGRIS